MNDYYQILGVSENASEQELKSAFRRLAKQHHPDTGGDPESFKKLNEAYTVLSNPEQRHAYNVARQGVHSQNTQRNQYHYPNEDQINDIFNSIFGSRIYNPPQQNQNLKMILTVALSSVLEDQVRLIQVNTGKAIKTLEVRVPRGIRNGAVITYPGYGKDTVTNAPPGDLYIEIAIENDPKFIRRGNDLISEITVDCLQAITGTDITFRSIRGNNLRLHVAPGTQPGHVMRIPNYGLPSLEENTVGDQYITVSITVPKNLSEKSLELIKQAMEIK